MKEKRIKQPTTSESQSRNKSNAKNQGSMPPPKVTNPIVIALNDNGLDKFPWYANNGYSSVQTVQR